MRFAKMIICLVPLIIFTSCASRSSNMVVAEFGDNKIYLDEFEKAYAQASGGYEKSKNDSLPAYKNFLDLYLNYKMKLRDAKVRGLDQDSDMKKEYLDYKSSIGKTIYLQNKLYEPNLKKLYERRKFEYRVSHIFLIPDSTRDAQQTMELGKKLIQRIQQGENFGALAKEYSKDSYTSNNGGDVYYVTAGMINIPAIEEAIYKTEPGQIFPELVASGYGHHILKVTSKESRKNSIRAQHILIPFADSAGVDSAKALKTISEIEQKIKSGADFGELAAKYSSDKGSAVKKGDLGYFSRGQMVKEFDEAAFKLKVGEVSPIVKTAFGYHLIRLTEITPLKSFEDEKQELKEMYDRVGFRNDYNNLVMNLKTEFNYSLNSATVNKILMLSDTMKIGKEYLTSNLKAQAGTDELFRFGAKSFNCDSLFNHLIKIGSYANVKVDGKVLQDAIDEYSSSLLVEEKALSYDKENPEFASLLSEYENGMYLFKILEEEVWSKITVDSSKIHSYWERTKENYRWKERVEFKEIHNSRDNEINDCYSAASAGVPFDTLYAKYNQRTNYTSKPGYKDLMEADMNELSKQAAALKNAGDFTKPFRFEDGWSIVKLIKREPAREKTYDEAKTEAASGLQESENKRLEEEYLAKLKNIYQPKFYYEELQNAFKTAH